jgi:ElaB/YqjD/DUF883 family membrane-anchored ribosome-binding protein
MADSNGEHVKAEAQRAREHAKAAGSAAADAIRENASSYADEARSRARSARDWANARFHDLQGRVEERPQAAAAWALGVGLLVGVLLTTMVRSRD